MSTHDKNGRRYAKLSELKAGDMVEVDNGFTCMSPLQHYLVIDHQGELTVKCTCGHHALEAQASWNDGHLTGIYKVTP